MGGGELDPRGFLCALCVLAVYFFTVIAEELKNNKKACPAYAEQAIDVYL